MRAAGSRPTKPRIDRRLWFTMEPGCNGKHYLICASHTFPGRFTAWCPLKKRMANCSFSDVRSASTEARYWLKGFLAGNEPPPPAAKVGSRELKTWERAARRFQKTGSWPLRDS
jgi:hypothetical protein